MGLLQPSLYRACRNKTVRNEMKLFGVNNNNNNNNNNIPNSDKLQNAYTEKMKKYGEFSIDVKQQWHVEAVYPLPVTISATEVNLHTHTA